ncbi:MAG: hypothetical protein AB9833_07460 [Bacteroidales bacterium]
MSEKSKVLIDDKALVDFLIRDFGERYIMYTVSQASFTFGFVGVTNISKDFNRGELIIGIIQKYRGRYDFLVWWINFLDLIKNAGIEKIYAKIKIDNKYVIHLSQKLGFMCADDLSFFSNPSYNYYYSYRETNLNTKELKFLGYRKNPEKNTECNM